VRTLGPIEPGPLDGRGGLLRFLDFMTYEQVMPCTTAPYISKGISDWT
jgi:hypothetical protein